MQSTGGAPSTDAVSTFARVLGETDGSVARLGSAQEIAAAIAQTTQEQGVRQVLYEPTEIVARLGLKLLLAAHGVELVTVAAAGEGAKHMKVALTDAQMAIAETGTILVGGRPGGWSLATVLPWVHIVLLPASLIVADLPTAFADFAQRLRDGDKEWVWITGPSRTADIGKTMVLGAHGPNALHVLIIE